MHGMNRRSFLAGSSGAAAGSLLVDLGFLAPLSYASAEDTRIDSRRVQLTADMLNCCHA
jgi:hypothetical protein